jgi:hypothetical protein
LGFEEPDLGSEEFDLDSEEFELGSEEPDLGFEKSKPSAIAFELLAIAAGSREPLGIVCFHSGCSFQDFSMVSPSTIFVKPLEKALPSGWRAFT